jgi:tagaturonate epimerase
VSAALPAVRGLAVSPRSLVVEDGFECALTQTDHGLRLAALGLDGLEGERDGRLLVGPLSAHNAAALRELLPWLRPRTLGLRGSIGLGDRLGLATSGHVRALRAADSGLAPVFAQQSVRELDRSGREAGDVLDAATWGAFAEGWREGFGADADHLKTPADIDRFVAQGYTFFTFDPSDHVRDDAVDAEAKYGRAIAHVASMYEHLRDVAPGEFEVEVSVDETETPTTHAEHAYIARELRHHGVEWVSLAPRYVGSFEKGIDYRGDVGRFADDVAGHAAIAERLGPYKLSLHSGSDKLSIYPAFAAATEGRMHVKTSGTSYLEALRTVARHDPEFVRDVYAFACERFEEDRASYHVDVARVPPADDALLDDDDARRILHVTFGSVLAGGLGDDLRARLAEMPEEYAGALERHFVRHLEALA